MSGGLIGLPTGDDSLPCLYCLEFVTLPGFIGRICNLSERTGKSPAYCAQYVIRSYHNDEHPLSLLVHALHVMTDR